jgi:putative peptidoglycan lipid II flippase
MKLFKAMATVAGMTFLSRILGFIRDMLTAIIMGAGPLADAFFVALKLPNLFRRISAEGAFTVSFVPLFSESLEKDGEEAAVKMARNMMGWMFIILSVLCTVSIFAMPYIIMAIAPGFNVDDVRYESAVDLARVTFPYLLLISLSSLIGGVMNTVGRFSAYAFIPCLFNISLIGALLFHDQIWNSPAEALAWGVLIAGFLQFAWMFVFAKRHNIMLLPTLPKMDIKVKKLGILMVPGIIGAGVYHLNLFADMIIASFLESGSISYLYYADRLQQLPLGVVGIAVGTALLPLLSRAIAGDQFDEAKNLFNRALEAVLLLSLPAATALMIAAEPIIRSLFHYGAFTDYDATTTALVLTCYAVGLPAYIAARVFQSACFARQDTKTPVKIAIICAGFNIVFALILSQFMGVAGIALGTGIVGWIQIVLLYIVMRRQERLDFDTRLIHNFGKIILSCVVMGIGICIFLEFADDVFQTQNPVRIPYLIAMVSVGGMLYGLSIMALKVMNISDFKKLLKKEA